MKSQKSKITLHLLWCCFFHVIFTALSLLSCREVILTKVIELPGFPTKFKFLHKLGRLHIVKQHFIDKKAYEQKQKPTVNTVSGKVRSNENFYIILSILGNTDKIPYTSTCI